MTDSVLPASSHSLLSPADASLAPVPLVSALVSTYRASRFMASLLRDLEAQTLVDQLEIVIVDSGSPENEGEIVREFQQSYHNIVYLRTAQRENTHRALNRCLQLARGKYVTLANTDDRHQPDAYARMAALLEARPDVALVYADLAETLNESDIICNRSLAAAEITTWYRLPEFNPISFFRQCYAGPQPMWRRSLHQHYGAFDPEFSYAGDYEFWLRLIAGGETFLHLPAVLGIMLHTSSSVSHAHAQALATEALRARRRYWPTGMEPALALLLGLSDLPKLADLSDLPASAVAAVAPEPFATAARVSVLIFVDKHPELLADTLLTVLDQAYPNLDLLLVNLSGNDLSDPLALLPGRPPMRILEASGVDALRARNLGLRLVTGAYLFCLHSGDRWHSGHLRQHLQALQTHDFVYSDAYRQACRQTVAGWERLARDLHNTPAFGLAGLLGQFVAPVASSYRSALLKTLPLEPAHGWSATEWAQWQEVEAYRRASLFGSAIRHCPDWDLQWLALQQAEAHRLPVITCEYLDQVAVPIPEQPLAQRLQHSVQGLAKGLAPGLAQTCETLAELALLVFAHRDGLEGFKSEDPGLLPAGIRQVVVITQHQTPPLPKAWAGDVEVLTLRLLRQAVLVDGQAALDQKQNLFDPLTQGLALVRARAVAVLVGNLDAAVAAALLQPPTGQGVWAFKKSAWVQLQAQEQMSAAALTGLLYAQTVDWQSWLAPVDSHQDPEIRSLVPPSTVSVARTTGPDDVS